MTIDVLPGETLCPLLNRAIEIAKENNCMVEFDFNNVNIRVTKNSDPVSIHHLYNNKISDSFVIPKDSTKELKKAIQTGINQVNTNNLINDFNNMDLDDLDLLIPLLSKIIETSNDYDVDINLESISEKLKQHGYLCSSLLPDVLNYNKENSAKELIGQFIFMVDTFNIINIKLADNMDTWINLFMQKKE